ncbi:CAP domain-containing protein [Companilactobacillus sp. FL22-1]|uniref:CAP domain-containing protein n=1 Tax=Companilactobacillus sp. FL22-1 TaxID=3373892 RepID=UPI0037553681
MFSKTKRAAILVAASALLATSLGGNVVLADVDSSIDGTTTSVTTPNKTNTNADSNLASTTKSTANSTDTSSSNSSSTNNSTNASTQSGYQNIDTASVKAAMLAELNRLRAQNGLSPLTSVNILNNYAQKRTDSFINGGGVDNHAGWNSAEMYPYNLTAEENIAQMPYSMIGSTDPTVIAQKMTHEFYAEMYDSQPNYGHRKNMLNPYINYVGVGVSISSNGMIYFSQEMGNDQAAYSKYDPSDVYAYYLTNNNDYANVSQYDLADSHKNDPDYANNANRVTVDLRGGVSTKDAVTVLYDRNGNKRTDLALGPNSNWISDLIAVIDGNYYYHVCTNGFVSANDALPWASFLAGASVTTTTKATVYDNNGNVTGAVLDANSKWVVDRRAVNPKTGIKMYRVATNSWIQENQLKQN